ncbi:hypothetical protein P6144_17145 [Sphingomonas sp. HITSZ_GF]|uniref:hypothetical protein n=1 Tax=Sphingomonas sp. HITSZ_GF TaxID=3037247 RepID=UPI00240D0772|nr:hypothetical protein [Sphingomonas sp. HITSZ_GF]MDG2535390.1 hypothetical protein [Sphingomonas sp. HITSZ_GF]
MWSRSVFWGLLLFAGFMTLFGLAMAGDAAMGHPRDGFLLPGLFAFAFGAFGLHGLLAGKVWASATMTQQAAFVVRDEDPLTYWGLILAYGLTAGGCAWLALT